MSHTFFFDIKRHVDHRIDAVAQDLAGPDLSGEDRRRAEGRLEVLTDFQRFIWNHLHSKLPKRLYRQVLATKCDNSDSKGS
jgi:hypothetical protein